MPHPETTKAGEITRERMAVVVAEWRDASRRIAEAKAALETAWADERRLRSELVTLELEFPFEEEVAP